MGNVEMTCCSTVGKEHDCDGSVPVDVDEEEGMRPLKTQSSFRRSESFATTVCPENYLSPSLGAPRVLVRTSPVYLADSFPRPPLIMCAPETEYLHARNVEA